MSIDFHVKIDVLKFTPGDKTRRMMKTEKKAEKNTATTTKIWRRRI